MNLCMFVGGFAVTGLVIATQPGCERKEKVLDVQVGGSDGVKVEGFRSQDGDVEIRVNEKN